MDKNISEIVILVIDDDYLTLESIKGILIDLKYKKILTAQDCEDAFELAKNHKPDLILMDIAMPALPGSKPKDGIDLATDIKKNLGIPIIFVSGLSDEETRQRLERVRPVGYVSKPINTIQLSITLESAIYSLSISDKSSSEKQQRNKVFVSYSHKDKKYFKQFKRHLDVLSDAHRIDIWDDTRIEPGMDWRNEIASALDTATIGILLVSIDFLRSEFIKHNELPVLLKAAELKGSKILYLLVGPCKIPDSISRFQSAWEISKSLSEITVAERDRVFTNVYCLIENILTRTLIAKRSA